MIIGFVVGVLIIGIFAYRNLAPPAFIGAQSATVASQPPKMDWNDVISLQHAKDASATMKPSCLMKLTANSGDPAQNIRNVIRPTVTELKGCEIYDAIKMTILISHRTRTLRRHPQPRQG
jgi:hypothetical protein